MELCNRGYNSNLKNLLVKHQNSSVYWHRWRLLSGVSLICFYGIIWEIFLAELHGWLTVDERAFARLYPWNHEVSNFLGRRRESEVIYRKKLHVPRLFYKIALRVFVAGKSSIASSFSLHTRPRARVDWVFVWDGLVFLSRINRIETRTIIYQSISLFVSHYRQYSSRTRTPKGQLGLYSLYIYIVLALKIL